MKIARHKKLNIGFDMNYPISCQLGDKAHSRYVYDCRIMDKETGAQDRVFVYGSHFGEVRWCMIGYTRRELEISDTSDGRIKHFVMPNDVGEQKFVIFVVRN